MIDQELESALSSAFANARHQRHEFITVDHLLLALLDDSSAAAALHECGARIEALRASLTAFIAANTPTVDGHDEPETQATLGFQRVIQRAIALARESITGQRATTGADVLLALFDERDSQAALSLHEQGVTHSHVRTAIATYT